MDAPAFPDLRAYLDQLRRDGDLVTVSAPVDARLEAAEIHRRVIAAGGPALLFTNVTGRSFPLVTNLFGTRQRVEKAFGRRPLDFVRRVAEIAQRGAPPTSPCCGRNGTSCASSCASAPRVARPAPSARS